MSWEVAPFLFSGRVYAELVLLVLQSVAEFAREVMGSAFFSLGGDCGPLINISSFFYCQTWQESLAPFLTS